MEATRAGMLIADRYEVGALLRRGGMAEVRDGLDRRLQRPVAVKLLRPEMAARPDVRVRFEVEAKAAARLAHPNVVAVYDTGEHEGVPYIVMERLPGRTLADAIAEGPVDVDWLLSLSVAVLSALAAAHDAAIVHRDVKPGNILLTTEGSAKVSDFGIAKSAELATGAADIDLTATGQLIGTPAYLAPERLAGAPATFLSDLYAMGVVLYEALTGEKPFAGSTFIEVARSVATGAHEPLGERRPDLDPALVAAVETALAVDPAQRFPSAEAMAAALVGPPATLAMPTDGVAAAPPASPAEETVALATATQLAPGPPLPIVPEPVPEHRRLLRPLAVGLAAILLLVLVAFAATRGSSSKGGTTPTTAPAAAPTTTPPPPTTAAAVVRHPTATPAPAPAPQTHKGHKGHHGG